MIVGQRSARNFRGSSCKLDDKEWEGLLETFLLQQPLNGNNYAAEALGKLEVSATISEESLLLVFRRSISGIKQRLGELALSKNENEEIELFGWLGTATARCDELVKELTNLDDRCKEQGQAIKVINQQLEDLIEAKIEHENSLLEKFRELLNAKKLKIRDLHRALAVARVDSENGAFSSNPFIKNLLKSNANLLLQLSKLSKFKKNRNPRHRPRKESRRVTREAGAGEVEVLVLSSRHQPIQVEMKRVTLTVMRLRQA